LPEPAVVALHQALSAAGLTELPTSTAEILEFAREHLLPVLADQLGARAAIAFMASATSRIGPRESDAPPSARRPIARVQVRSSSAPVEKPAPSHAAATVAAVGEATRGVWLLVEQDPVARVSLARALVQCRVSVRVVATMDDLSAALASAEPIDAAVVDAQHPSAASIVDALAQVSPDLVIVARACDEGPVHQALTRLGIRRFGVCARYASAPDLLGMIQQLRVKV
jgi:CheY-like chemotaxis protein